MDVNKQTLYGFTPLMLAACWGREDCAALLLDLGADPTACDRHGRTALEMASDGMREHLVRHPVVSEGVCVCVYVCVYVCMYVCMNE